MEAMTGFATKLAKKKSMMSIKPSSKPQKLPDYLLDSDAVLKDDVPSWRYGRAPDYTKTREVYNQSMLYLSHDEY